MPDQTFSVRIQSPGHVVISAHEVEKAVIRLITNKDEKAERYGPALAGYKIKARLTIERR